jgi:hypothetical protein
MKTGKHSLLMMAGCGAMLAGVFLLPLLGVKLGGVLPLLFALACPLSMVFMMGAMGKSHDHSRQGSADRAENGGAACHGKTAPRAVPAPPDQN